MLILKDVEKTYGVYKTAVDKVSLQVAPGEIVGLFGENGAGKTTLLKSILGLLRHGGTVELDGEPVGRSNIHRLAFATCEHSFFPDLTASAHRDFMRDHFPGFREKRFKALTEFFDLPTDRAARRLSTGQKNQLEVILALCQGADYILMDEPFAGNDVFNRDDFYKVLLGILEPTEAVILSTHLIEEVDSFISRAVLLRAGKVVGDVSVLDLEERGETLMGFIQKTYHRSPDRVARALDQLTGGEEEKP